MDTKDWEEEHVDCIELKDNTVWNIVFVVKVRDGKPVQIDIIKIEEAP